MSRRGLQEAYVRGVSAWNFDVAALKSNAASEGASDLGTVPEGTGGLLPSLPDTLHSHLGIDQSCISSALHPQEANAD